MNGIQARAIRGDDDFWRVHALLVETHAITAPGFNWNVRRWEGSRFYGASEAWDPRWEKTVQLWETPDGRLVGAVHPEGKGEAHLELHPDYRFLEEEIIEWAEVHLAVPTKDGTGRVLHTFVFEYDIPRRLLLERRGYEKLESGGVTRRMRLGLQPLPKPVIADGYTLRTTRPDEPGDCQRVSDVINAGFGRDSHTPVDYHTFTRLAPCFRHGVDLVAEAPDGSFAAYVGVPFDEANRCGQYEPVCTHPDHRRKGLAQALMLDGLHRMRALGAAEMMVDTGDMVPANRLYDSVGFTEAYKGHVWRKTLA